MKSYETLYPQILDLIERKMAGYANEGSLQSITGVATDSGRSLNETVNELAKFFVTHSGMAELTGKIEDLAESIEYMVDEVIIEGLDVTATVPPSNDVNISVGLGGKRGRPCRLDAAKTITIPLDAIDAGVFFVTLQSYGQIKIRQSRIDDELTLARIVIPWPGTTSKIRDDEELDTYDGYIVSAKDAFFDGDQEFDEDSKMVLREAIGDINAQNIVGDFVISDRLRLTNLQGTLDINSKLMMFKDAYGRILAKFTDDGVYFYAPDGSERSHFNTVDARIGNILITHNSIQSGNFVTGVSGFQIRDNGDAEFNNIKLRGTLYTSTIAENITINEGIQFIGDVNLTQKLILNDSDVDGDTYWVYNDVTNYLEGWVDGVKRIEL